MTYRNYLNSTHWREIKAKIYATGHRRCAICGVDYGLNVHHMTYESLNKERFIDLLVLCSTCHRKHHQGIISEEDLKFISSHRKMFKQPTDYHMKKRLKKKKNRSVYKSKQRRLKNKLPTYNQLRKKLGTVQFYKLEREEKIEEGRDYRWITRNTTKKN